MLQGYINNNQAFDVLFMEFLGKTLSGVCLSVM